MIYISIILIAIGSGFAIFLFWQAEEGSYIRFIDEFRPLFGRLSCTLLGIGLLLLGLTFVQNTWTGATFVGTFLFITGAQISLWSVGISLDFLANKPVFSDRLFEAVMDMEREIQFEDRSRSEEDISYEAYYLAKHLRKYELDEMMNILEHIRKERIRKEDRYPS